MHMQGLTSAYDGYQAFSSCFPTPAARLQCTDSTTTPAEAAVLLLFFVAAQQHLQRIETKLNAVYSNTSSCLLDSLQH